MKGNNAFDQLSYDGNLFPIEIKCSDKGDLFVICPLDNRRRSYYNYCHDNCLGYTGGCNYNGKNCVRCKYNYKSNNNEKD